MLFLITISVLVLGLVTLVLVIWVRYRKEQRTQPLDQARLKIIEAQIAGLKAAQRIQAAEYHARRHMHQFRDHGVFRNPTIHEEPDQWR